ncbi:MAG: nicotinamide-nucleotide amidohydrolase family protein [Lachnospiraceae bacterium]|nr:nicotinamide-nucleotide amidohydrolase family protein [Lachnospiraceae bacterium]
MVVEIISVGNELLTGTVVNSNAAFLAEQCVSLGFECFYQTVVGDDKTRLQELIKTAEKRADIILINGGLGQAADDITKDSVKEVYDKATVLELENQNGPTNGFILEEQKKRIILLPGSPKELEPMFTEQVFPYLQEKTDMVICTRTIKLCGISEAKVNDAIADLMNEEQKPLIATYAKCGEVHVRVTAKADREKDAVKMIKPVVKELKHRFNMNIYTTHEETSLEQSCVDLLLANNLRISTMESCTGGMLAARLINVPGVSEVFKVGYVTYSNKAKRKVLGVKQSTLKKYTAVSAEVAKEMVQGISMLTKADVTVSVTGLAGPDGGTKEKPVGLVYIGCNVKGKTVVEEYHFAGDRMHIREEAVVAALALLRQCVLEYFSEVTFGNK